MACEDQDIALGGIASPCATVERQRAIVALTVEATPHPTLSPNDRSGWRVKSAHRQALRQAAKLAMHNAMIRRPEIAQEAREGRLRFRIAIVWERSRQGRLMDADNALAACKGLVDGIAEKLERDDRDFVFAPVEQSTTEDRQGVTIVVIEREEVCDLPGLVQPRQETPGA